VSEKCDLGYSSRWIRLVFIRRAISAFARQASKDIFSADSVAFIFEDDNGLRARRDAGRPKEGFQDLDKVKRVLRLNPKDDNPGMFSGRV